MTSTDTALVPLIKADTTEASEARTKPTIKQIAVSTTLLGKPVQAGDKVSFWNGTEVAYHVVTKGEMVKVERFRSRTSKQRQHLSDKIAREDAAAERELTAARRAEAARRMALHTEAVARMRDAL